MAFFVVVPAVGAGIAAVGSAITAGLATIGTAVAGAVGITATGTLATAIGAGTISGAITAVQGGDLGDVFKSAVIGGATSYFGSTIASEIAGSVTASAATTAADLGYGSLASSLYSTSEAVIKSGLTSAFNAALTGRDVTDALITGGLTGGISEGLSVGVASLLEDVPEWDQFLKTDFGSATDRAFRNALAANIVTDADIFRL